MRERKKNSFLNKRECMGYSELNLELRAAYWHFLFSGALRIRTTGAVDGSYSRLSCRKFNGKKALVARFARQFFNRVGSIT